MKKEGNMKGYSKTTVVLVIFMVATIKYPTKPVKREWVYFDSPSQCVLGSHHRALRVSQQRMVMPVFI